MAEETIEEQKPEEEGVEIELDTLLKNLKRRPKLKNQQPEPEDKGRSRGAIRGGCRFGRA